MGIPEAKTRIRAFLERFIPDAEFTDDDDIFALGLVNSLMAMQLVMFLEKEFSLTFTDTDLDLANFRSITAMTGVLTRRGALEAAATP